MKQFAFLTACAAFFLGSCDQHEWESKPGKPGTEELFGPVVGLTSAIIIAIGGYLIHISMPRFITND